MNKKFPTFFFLFLTLLLLATPGMSRVDFAAAQPEPAVAQPNPVASQANVEEALQSAPVMFIENVGQFDDDARFHVRGGNLDLWLADDALWITLLEAPDEEYLREPFDQEAHLRKNNELDEPRQGVNLKLSFVDANPQPEIEPFNLLDTKMNYFLGNDSDKWRSNVPVWGGVRYKEIYPGIDLELTSQNGHSVQRLVVHSRANFAAAEVQLHVEGADQMELETSRTTGETMGLTVKSAIGDVTLPLFALVTPDGTPLDSTRVPILNDNHIQAPFAPANQEPFARVPDSILTYSTFIGGRDQDDGYELALDSAGNAVVTGETWSSDFPTTAGGYDTTYNGGYSDAFVLQLSSAGDALLYSTFIGGSSYDHGNELKLDSAGHAVVTGYTSSSDFPTTVGSYDTSYNGGSSDTFVLKLAEAGNALVYSTFIGGTDRDEGKSLALDSAGNAVVTGYTLSLDFPTTAGSYDTTFNGREDTFVLQLSSAGDALLYSTFIGSSNYDRGESLALDSAGHAVVTGLTESSDFPTTAGSYDTIHNGGRDTFVLKLNAAGDALTYSTFIGGSSDDNGNELKLDSVGNAVVTGVTESLDFPTTAGSYDMTHNGDSDTFVLQLSEAGNTVTYSTFIGGSSRDYGRSLALDSAGNAVVTGNTSSPDFPTTEGSYDTTLNDIQDIFVLRLDGLVPASSSNITLSPTSVSVTLNEGESTTEALTISNTGTSDLEWAISSSADWLTVTPASGTVAPDSSALVSVGINSTGLSGGIYTDTVTITSNDLDEPSMTVPVSLTVQAPLAAKIAVSPSAMSESLFAGEQSSETLIINNTGTAELQWQASSEATWLSVEPTNGTAVPAGSASVSVGIDASGLSAGTYNDTLTLTSNDPDEPSVEVPVEVTVMSPGSSNLLAIYALAFDNPVTATHNLAPQFPETMQSIVDATVGVSDKRAVVLVDLPEEGNTHIRVVENGVETLIGGLPDEDGELDFELDEYDMADGATLGGFLKWTLDTYANEGSKTLFSYVGHGSALVPETNDELFSGHDRALFQGPSVPIPSCYDAHSAFTDSHPRSALSPYDLATALDFATNDGQNPIDVLDLVQCFSASIEQFYELSNPDGTPYAAMINGAPNFAYLNPKMLGVALAASSPTDNASTLASSLLDTYNTVLAEDDSDPSRHPRLLVAVDSSKMKDIPVAWDYMSGVVMDEFALNHQETKDKITNAYLASAKYDSTFCQSDWSLQAPDALVDMVDFAYKLSEEFGLEGSWADTTRQNVQEAIVAKHYTNGQPWLANLEPIPTWNFDNHEGLALYADFLGMILDSHPDTIMLNWQAHWYTDEVSEENQHPYAFVRDTQWDEVIQTFWQGENVDTMACLAPLPPALRSGDVSADRILFPLSGFVTKDSPALLSAVISVSAPESRLNPQVEFTVIQSDTIVFSDTVSAGTLLTGTYQVDASRDWVPDRTGPFTLTVTVDADNRVEETNENDNRVSYSDRVLWPLSRPRPMIEASVSDGREWITDTEVMLDIVQMTDTISAPVATLEVHSYYYQAGDDPKTHVPVEIGEQTFTDIELPLSDFRFSLPEQINPGPVVLHVWAISGGGPSTHPQIIHFNYLPQENTIRANETQYFVFYAGRGERLQMELDVGENEDANLFIWDPHSYGRPLWHATNPGDDTISIDPTPADGRYVVAVHGETSSHYTLTQSDLPITSMAKASRTNNNPAAYVPDEPPTFSAPLREEPDADPSASEIRISNVRDVSFTVSWLTEWETMGEVRYGTDPNDLNQTAHDKRGADTNDDTHIVMINDLMPETTYYFDIVSGTTTDDNQGEHYTVTTGPILNPPDTTIYLPVITR